MAFSKFRDSFTFSQRREGKAARSTVWKQRIQPVQMHERDRKLIKTRPIPSCRGSRLPPPPSRWRTGSWPGDRRTWRGRITVSVRELIPVAETGEVELIPAELLALGLGLVLAKRLVDD